MIKLRTKKSAEKLNSLKEAFKRVYSRVSKIRDGIHIVEIENEKWGLIAPYTFVSGCSILFNLSKSQVLYILIEDSELLMHTDGELIRSLQKKQCNRNILEWIEYRNSLIDKKLCI